jgi:hypothetical protein
LANRPFPPALLGAGVGEEATFLGLVGIEEEAAPGKGVEGSERGVAPLMLPFVCRERRRRYKCTYISQEVRRGGGIHTKRLQCAVMIIIIVIIITIVTIIIIVIVIITITIVIIIVIIVIIVMMIIVIIVIIIMIIIIIITIMMMIIVDVCHEEFGHHVESCAHVAGEKARFERFVAK